MAPGSAHIQYLVEVLEARGYEINEGLVARIRAIDARHTAPATEDQIIDQLGFEVVADAVASKCAKDALTDLLTQAEEEKPAESRFMEPWTPPKRARR